MFLWIPAYAGMTGESLRNPVPELVEECPRTFVILANAGIHSLLSFRVFPWLILLLAQSSLTLPALKDMF